jgi:hypothetical protein
MSPRQKKTEMRMKKLATVASLAVLGAGLAGPAAALDQDKCADLWNRAAQQNDSLSLGEAGQYIVDFNQVDTDGNGQISETEFKDGCKNDLVQSAAATPGSMSNDPAESGAGANPGSPQDY